jgi:hypothetical protein
MFVVFIVQKFLGRKHAKVYKAYSLKWGYFKCYPKMLSGFSNDKM